MKPDYSFALFTNASSFSLGVCEYLSASRLKPALIVLPEYAPAAIEADPQFQLDSAPAQPRISALLPGVPIEYAPAADNSALYQRLRQFPVDFILVACWPYLIDARIYRCAASAALNLHPSRLPDYRGPDPLRQQIAAGETQTGVTLHLLDAQFDHGDIVGQACFSSDHTGFDRHRLERRCAELGVGLFARAMADYAGTGWCLSAQD